MNIKITKSDVHSKSKKMSKEELQQHLKHMKNSAKVHETKKGYNRKKQPKINY